MDVKAEHRYAKISAFKVREVTREIQGLHAVQALEIVRLIPKKASRLISKVLASAIANAENNNNLRAENLVIKQAVAGEGPTLKRMHTRARGGGARINKRTAHIKITLTEAEPIAPKAAKAKAAKKAKPAASKSTVTKQAEREEAKASAAPALIAPEPDASELKGEKADSTSRSLAAGDHPEKVSSAEHIEE
jgi:large subunit ribosomal protein L22